MKKTIALAVSILMVLTMVLAGCGGNSGSSSSAASSAPAAAESSAKSEAPAKPEASSASSEASEPAASAEKASQEYTIVIMPKILGIPYFNASETGALQAGEDLGVNVIYAGPTETDASAQVNMLEDFIAQGVDAIAVSPNDPATLTPVLKKAKEAGILVMDWDATAEKDAVDYSVHQVDDVAYGEQIFQAMAENIPEDGSYAILTGGLEAANLNLWIDSGIAWLEENYPNITLVTDRIPCDEQPTQAYQKAQDVIKSYPDLDAIVAISATNPPPVGQAVQEANMQDQIYVVGTGTPNDCNVFLKDGSLDDVMLWDPAQLGYLTIWVALQALEGNELTDGMPTPCPGVEKLWMVDDKTIIMGPATVFTAENVDDFDF